VTNNNKSTIVKKPVTSVSKIAKPLDKEQDDDFDFKKFMAKYEKPDEEMKQINSDVDKLLGQTLANLSYFKKEVDDNPYKRSKKEPEPLKNYNKPDPSFDYILNLQPGAKVSLP
jgi:hypothetical protein